VDLAVADYSGNSAFILLGNGDGTFRPAGNYSLESWSTFIAAWDFNGDGKPDLVVSHPLGGCCSFQANGEVSILLGNGDGTFRPPVDYLAGQVPVNNKPQCVAVADFNGDGNADLAVADGAGFNISILLGNGDGTFRPSVDYAVGGDAAYVAVGDFNGDGRLDIAIGLGPSSSATGLSILLGNGDGTFQRPANYSAPGPATAVVVGEFNGDGKTDVAVAAASLSILLGGLLPAPDLTIAKSHIRSFLQGPSAGTYSIIVSNVGNASTFGTVTVIDTLPNGLTTAAVGGTGWTCSITNATCTRADPLPAGASYPAISITVNVAAGTPATVINTAIVSGGGETNITNDTASDPTQITISLLSQTITFGPVSDQALGTTPFSLTASASSGLPVSFTTNTNGVCTISGTVVSLVSIGICSITATQNGNAVYAVAMPVTQSFRVKIPQTIIFGPLSDFTLVTHVFSVNASASSGLPVQFASITPLVCMVFGSTVTLLAAGTCTITATQPGNDSFAPALPVMQTFTVIGPTISGISPVDSLLTAIQPGSWASIYGSNLASATAMWNGDFPPSLGGTTVSINGKPAYLSYVSPTLINLQAPDDSTAGTVEVGVTNATGSVTAPVVLAPLSPSFLVFDDGRHVAAYIPTPDGTGAYASGAYDVLGPAGAFAFNTRPVKQGEILCLYGVGFGPTNPPVPAGKGFSGAALTIYPVAVTIGGLPANVLFAGIAEAGLYQINVTVPNTGSGDKVLQATVNNVQTQLGRLVTVQ